MTSPEDTSEREGATGTPERSAAQELAAIEPVLSNGELHDFSRAMEARARERNDFDPSQETAAGWIYRRLNHTDDLVRSTPEGDRLVERELRPPSMDELNGQVQVVIAELVQPNEQGLSILERPADLRAELYGPQDERSQDSSTNLPTAEEIGKYLNKKKLERADHFIETEGGESALSGQSQRELDVMSVSYDVVGNMVQGLRQERGRKSSELGSFELLEYLADPRVAELHERAFQNAVGEFVEQLADIAQRPEDARSFNRKEQERGRIDGTTLRPEPGDRVEQARRAVEEAAVDGEPDPVFTAAPEVVQQAISNDLARLHALRRPGEAQPNSLRDAEAAKYMIDSWARAGASGSFIDYMDKAVQSDPDAKDGTIQGADRWLQDRYGDTVQAIIESQAAGPQEKTSNAFNPEELAETPRKSDAARLEAVTEAARSGRILRWDMSASEKADQESRHAWIREKADQVLQYALTSEQVKALRTEESSLIRPGGGSNDPKRSQELSRIAEAHYVQCEEPDDVELLFELLGDSIRPDIRSGTSEVLEKVRSGKQRKPNAKFGVSFTLEPDDGSGRQSFTYSITLPN